ncbi:alpha/beta hydrolase [Pseudalkalibacillus sp. SCS-8]|uniref:alpha/beta hydrolase n=1 Tax=Pseudalkalibacillus nanhaiensis TaxID=3115291 RepID=UPI0032DA14B7
MCGHSHRFFKLNDQCVITHIPERPNGFAIILIGDVNHYVTDQTSSWLQHPERSKFLDDLCSFGYTIFYSNLYGRHWGNERSVDLLNRMYHTILKQEIINPKIHILAEGMGALSALKWLEGHGEKTRSAAFLNPCLSLKVHGEAVREQKLFYKSFHREICQAYELSEHEADEFIQNHRGYRSYTSNKPVKIWHNMHGSPYSFMNHSRAYEHFRDEIGAPISLSLQLSGNKQDFARKVKFFFQQHEKDL